MIGLWIGTHSVRAAFGVFTLSADNNMMDHDVAGVATLAQGRIGRETRPDPPDTSSPHLSA